MACYVDTSAWLALLGREASAASVAKWMGQGMRLQTANWTAVELASGLGVKARRGDVLSESVRSMCAAFDDLLEFDVDVLSVEADDFRQAKLLCQKTELGLRAGDALHLAIALRNNSSYFLSLDHVLNRNAQAAGLQLVELEKFQPT